VHVNIEMPTHESDEIRHICGEFVGRDSVSFKL